MPRQPAKPEQGRQSLYRYHRNEQIGYLAFCDMALYALQKNNSKPDMNFKPQAFLFDLNGTMIDDMEFHQQAWTSILNEDLKANLQPEQVKAQMYGKNDELLERVFGRGHFTKETMSEISKQKEKKYQHAFLPHLRLIRGLDEFLEKARNRQVLMAIGSAAIPFNINFVLDNLHIRDYFNAIVSADDVAESKPHPETFLKAADLLGEHYQDCLVFEDAPKGVEAAQHAGMKAVVLTTMHQQEAFSDYSNIIAFIKDFTDPVLDKLF